MLRNCCGLRIVGTHCNINIGTMINKRHQSNGSTIADSYFWLMFSSIYHWQERHDLHMLTARYISDPSNMRGLARKKNSGCKIHHIPAPS